MNPLAHLLALIEAISADRMRFAFENILMQQQIAELKRGVTRLRSTTRIDVLGAGDAALEQLERSPRHRDPCNGVVLKELTSDFGEAETGS